MPVEFLEKMQLLYLFVFTCCCDSVLWRFWVVTHVVDTNVWCFLEVMWRISHDGHRPDLLLLLLLLLENVLLCIIPGLVRRCSSGQSEVHSGSIRGDQRSSGPFMLAPVWAGPWGHCWSQPSLFRLRLKQMLTLFSFLQLLNSLQNLQPADQSPISHVDSYKSHLYIFNLLYSAYTYGME